MSTDRETTRIVRSWLEDGVTQLPGSVLDEVLDELPTTHQRRATWWSARRAFEMNKVLAYSAAAAAILIVAVLGINLLASGGSNVGGPGDEPTPSPSASPLAWPDSPRDMVAGTYVSDSPESLRSTVTVPAGWAACGVDPGEFVVCAPPGAVSVLVTIVDNVVSDPCDRSRALLDPPVGESVDALVAAISNLSGFQATDPGDITLDGYMGKEFELAAPTEPDCVLDDNGLGTWTFPSGFRGTNGVSPGETNLLRIIDVDGVRVMIAGAYQPFSSAAEVAELRAVFDSVRVAP